MIQKVFRALAETALVWLTGFWAGYRPGPQLGVCMREATYWYFSYTLMFLVLSPSLPLSLKINRIFFLIRLSGMMQDGWESVESDPHSGRPATSRTPENVEHVWVAINSDWRLTMWKIHTDLSWLQPIHIQHSQVFCLLQAFQNMGHFQQILDHLIWSICATFLFVLHSLHHPWKPSKSFE